MSKKTERTSQASRNDAPVRPRKRDSVAASGASNSKVEVHTSTVTVSELRRNLGNFVGGMERTVVTRDNQPASVLMHVKDFAHREALLRWALDDPEGWAEARRSHRRVQREGARGISLEELEDELRPATVTP